MDVCNVVAWGIAYFCGRKINLCAVMKKELTRIVAAAVLLAAASVVEYRADLEVWQLLVVYLVPYLVVGYDVLAEAVEGLLHGKVFNECLLMCIATVGALSIGFLPGTENEFAEAVFVMLFFKVGEAFEGYAEGRSRRAISHLMEIRPDNANVVRGAAVTVVPAESVAVGETIVVKPGERVPLDGVVTDGQSSLDTVALTGESLPCSVAVGDSVASGCVNISGLLTLRVTKAFGESTASKIISMVESASEKKSRSETFISRFARVYTPVVVLVAVLLAFFPPMLSGSFSAAFPVWFERALTFLVVSCPCALVISVPLTFFGGIGGASRNGILVKGSSYIDVLARVGTVVFDKTGTLTKGRFEVEAVHPDRCDERRLLHLAAHVERYSTHPIAQSLRNAYPEEDDGCSVEDVEEVAGHGVRARVNGCEVCVGNATMMESLGVQWRPCHKVGTIVHVTIGGEYAGHIVVNDAVKEDSRMAIDELRGLGIGKAVMLTGDRDAVGRDVATRVGIDEYHAGMMPADKLAVLEDLLAAKPRGTALAFVGDGINDAPVLARADVGIAMGGLGSDAAIEAADVVLMDDKPTKVALAVRLSRRTRRIASQNVWFAIGVKVVVLALAGMGVATMWMAVFADVGVTVLAVLNAMRAMRIRS